MDKSTVNGFCMVLSIAILNYQSVSVDLVSFAVCSGVAGSPGQKVIRRKVYSTSTS
jgi:hypothetical protein